MLEIKNLVKTYATKLEKKGEVVSSLILDRISLRAAEGEFVSIIGPSGCGKSTLFNLISGLEVPEEGQILLHGKEIMGERGHVSYMLQRIYFFPGGQFWIIILGWSCGFTRKDCRSKAQALLEEFGLVAYSNSYPYALSGGCVE